MCTSGMIPNILANKSNEKYNTCSKFVLMCRTLFLQEATILPGASCEGKRIRGTRWSRTRRIGIHYNGTMRPKTALLFLLCHKCPYGLHRSCL
ncbi:unnamed protein product [Ixodes pacificus]